MFRKYLIVKCGRCQYKIVKADIMFIRKYKQLCFVHTVSGTYKVSCSLRSFLTSPLNKVLTRAHRSIVVNMDHVKGLSFRRLYVGDTPLPVDPSCYKKLQKLFLQYT